METVLNYSRSGQRVNRKGDTSRQKETANKRRLGTWRHVTLICKVALVRIYPNTER